MSATSSSASSSSSFVASVPRVKRKRHKRGDVSRHTSPSDSDVASAASPSSSKRRTNHKEISQKSKKKKSKKTKKHTVKEKKQRKRKRHHKSSKSEGTVTNRWGKYGLIQESDLWRKKQEFQLWLIEIKNKNMEELAGWEEKLLFKDFMEDYNTATLPHKKFYDLEKYERRTAMKKQKAADEPIRTEFNDEAMRKQEIKRIREHRASLALREEFANMKENTEKVQAMKHQRYLRERMDALFKMGRMDEGMKVQELLKPDP